MADETVSLPIQPNPSSNGTSPPRAPRRVYEPTLLPPRKHRRAPRWLVLSGIFLGAGLLYYFAWFLPHQRRFVLTVGKIVFASDQGSAGVPHLWIAGGDGTAARRLTSGAAPDTEPVFSPDGSQIAFLSTRFGNQNQLFVVDADGENLTQETRSAGSKDNIAFAPSDNELLGYTSGGTLNSYDLNLHQSTRLLPVITADSRNQDTDAAASADSVTVPAYAWTPGTERATQGVAAVEDTGAYQSPALLPTVTAKARILPLPADAISLAWSPDGALLAVAAIGVKGVPGGRQLSAIFLLNSQGGLIQQTPLAAVSNAKFGPQNPVFPPDGSQIVFEAWQMPDSATRKCLGLFVVPTGGGAPHQLYKGDASQARFLDDAHIAFLAARPGGGHALYRAALDGSAPLALLSDSAADVSSFAVSPQRPRAR